MSITEMKVDHEGFEMEIAGCNSKSECVVETPEIICIDIGYWCMSGKYISFNIGEVML